jgi:hypothetical protein
MAPIYKVYVNGIVDFVTGDHNKFNDTVGHYIDQFYKSEFTMVFKDGTARDMHYVFYNYKTRKTGSVGYEIK